MTTSTLMEIIQSELINSGHDEFFGENQIQFFNDEYAFIKKTIRMDQDVYNIITDKFFQGFKFDTRYDEKIKHTFIAKFYNREIKTQTIEDFASKVLYVSLSHEDYINNLYENILEFVNGSSSIDYKPSSETITDNRTAYVEHPQNQINLDVDDTTTEYANNNNIQRSRVIKKNNDTSQNYNFDIDNLSKAFDLIDRIFKHYDRKCFLQIW